MKITKPVYLYGEQSEYCLREDGTYGPGIRWTITPAPSEHWGALAKISEITIEVPDEWDPRPGMIEQLRKQQQELRAKAESDVRQIDERIASLLAIECKVAA